MNEEYLKGLHGYLGIEDDYDTWVNAIQGDQEYLKGLHGYLKIDDDFDIWNNAVFGREVKKKEDSQEPFQFGVSDTPSAVQSQEVEEQIAEQDRVESALAFDDAFNPVGRAIKKIPGMAELYSGVENIIGSVFKAGEMAIRENVFSYSTANPGYAAAQNVINSAAPVDNKIADALGYVADTFMEDSKRTLLSKQKDYGLTETQIGEGIVGNVINGDVGAAAKLTASTIAHQIPQLAAMVATGPVAGAALLGTSSAGNKYAEIQNDPTLSSQDKALYSVAIGTAEGLAEYMFRTDVSQIRRAFGKKETLDQFRDALKKELKKETLIKSTLEEGGEELAVGIADLLIEDGLRGNFDNWDADAVLELADAALIGGIMGGGVHSVTRGVNALGSTKNEREIARAKQDINTLNNKKADATEAQKKIIDELIDEKLSELTKVESEDIEFYKKFNSEDLTKVNDLNKNIRKAAAKYNAADSEADKNKYKKEVDDLRSQKEEIENKYSDTPRKYIKDGKEVSRAEFVDMINQATPEELTTGQWGVQNDDEVEQLLMSKLPQDDRKEEERVPSAEQEGQAPVKAEPIQEPSPEEAAPSRVVQEAEEVAPTEEVDTEAVKIEKETISDAEFRIEDLQSEIDIEKGNIKEAKDKSKEDIAAVRKSDLTADEKKERIAEIKAELQDAVDEMNGNIGIYKEDISAFKSDIRKAQKKLAKLEAPKAVAAVKEPTPSVPEEAQIKPEAVVSEKDAQGNERFFAAYPVKDKPIKAFFEVKTDKDGNIIRVSDKSYGPARKTLKRRLLAEAVAKPKGKIKEQLETVATPVSAIGKKADNMVSNFNNALKSIGADNIAVYAVSDVDMKSITGSTSRAQFRVLEDGTSAIILNTDKATLGSLSHEMLHAYVKAVKLTGDKVVSFTNQIKTQLAKGNNSEKALAKKLQEFQEAYIQREVYGKGLTLDDPNISEEFLAEYAAQIKDGIDVQKMSLSTIEKIRKAVAKILNDVLGIKVDDTAIKSKEEAFDFINGFLDALEGRGDLTAKINPERSAVVNNKNPYEASRLQLDVPVGSRIANKPLKDARTIAIAYMESKGLKHTDGNLITKIDKKLAKRISDAYAAMKNNPKDSEVAAAYKAMAEETIEQYEAIIKGGYKLEVNNNEPYNNSNELIEDLRKNKNMRIFSTDSGFGDAGITADQRKDNPLLAETKYKDVNGRTLLVNDIFRFVHDFFGHAERGNGFGPIGEENAWDVHSRMYSPLARKALTAETRGQNSYVNFSGINDEAFKLRDKGRALRKEGKFEEAQKFTDQAYDMMKFAPQKVGLLPDEFVANPYLEEKVEEQGESGEVGTISIPKEQIEVIDAPKALEDPRDFVRDFVSDIDIKELSGRKFVTNMYDYTNAGLTQLGKGLSINLLGGRNYVPLMLKLNGKKLGEVSNLAAFNTKAQAEGFIRNAQEGKADLFAPHAGTLTDSWQFQHHIFEELVRLVLENKIMSKAKLIETFNEAIKSKEGAKAFNAFNDKNKSRLKNLNSFKNDPMKLVKLLNAENNYSPNLRKALNQKIAASKDFQQAIGIKNLNQFYNLIADPLNEGVSGGEVMTFVEFDPKTFKVVKTKPGAANHHPSFGWVVMAKIKRILQPNKYYKSYDLTKEYTKYNVSGPEVSTKEDPKFAVSNVTSSAGAIPKVAKVDVRQQIDWQRSEFGKDKVNGTIITRSQLLQQAVQDLLEGKITNAEYQETARIVSQIDPIAKFFLPASNEDMENALGKGKSKKLNIQLEDGEYVGLRLDIPAYVNNNIWVVTAHKGNGAPLTYGSVAWATDVKFGTNPKVAAFIAAGKNMDLVGRYRIDPLEVDGKTVYKFLDTKTGKYYAEKGVDVTKNTYKAADQYVADRLEKQDKSTIGKMLGRWKNFEGKTKEERDAAAIKKVEEIVKIENSFPGSTRKGSPWRQIGMNPFRHSFFYDRRTGQPVVAASEVVQIGGLVYAKDVEYADWSDDQFTVEGYKDADGQTVRFQIDGDAESKVDNEVFKALEKGEIPAPLYEKTWYQKVYSALFRTPLETELIKIEEKKAARVSFTEYKAREISRRIKKYAKTPEALKLANEYLTAEDKKNAAEAIKKLPTGQQLLNNLRVARAFIDNISQELVNNPSFDGLPDDLRFAIQNNVTTYLRTSYRFFTDKNYDIKKRRDPAIQAQFDRLVSQEIGMLGAMGMSELDINAILNERRDDLVQEATQIIDSYISDLQDVKYQPSTSGAGIKMPSAPFRRKKELPDYIKQLLGEEKDPVKRFSQTAQALSNVLYKGKMVNGIIDLVGKNSDYILDEEPQGVKAKQYKKVNDPYSLLDGKWVHNEILNAIDRKPLYSGEGAWQIYFNLVRLSRKSKVIWNFPSSFRKNLTGGWYFILANGIVNPTFYKDFTRRTKLTFSVRGEKFQIDDETKRLIEIMADKGVSGKSVDANLIGFSQATYQFAIDGDEDAYIQRVKKTFNITSKNLKNVDKWLQEKYSSIDDYTKLVIFRSEIESYAKKLYGKNYEQLNDSQKDNVHEQAAERVKQSTPTFSRLPKWFDKIAAVPVVAPFVSFTMESLRSYGANVANAVSDIKKSQETGLEDVQKKEYLKAGLRRLAGSGAAIALRFGIVELFTQWFLDDDDEELAEDAIALRPDWMDGHHIIPRSIDNDGNVRVYNYSTEDPYNDVSKLLSGPGSWGDLLNSFVGPDIAADVIMNIVKNKDIYGKDITDYSDSDIDKTLDLLGYGVKQIAVPPTISSVYRDAWKKSDAPSSEKAINVIKLLGERSVIRDYKYNVVDSFVQDLRKISGTRKTYMDYDNPALRLKQLDDIKNQFKSIVAIGLAKGNYDMIDKAERYMKNHLGDEDQDYVEYGIIIKK